MKQYVVTYDNSKGLLADYQNIEGKTALDALEKAFGKKYKRLTGNAGRYATKILVNGYYNPHTNRIKVNGRYQMLCYEEA